MAGLRINFPKKAEEKESKLIMKGFSKAEKTGKCEEITATIENTIEKLFSNNPIKPHLGGTLIDSNKRKMIENNKEYIQYVKTNYSEYGNLRQVLGGDSILSNGLSDNLGSIRGFDNKGYKIDINFKGSFSKRYDTGADYRKLELEQPYNQYKFYVSLLLDTEEKNEYAKSFLKEIIDYCFVNKLSFAQKSWDHNYDSIDMYTRDKDKIIPFIQSIYPKYEKLRIFNAVPHFLQGSINGISADHIGIVNEPVGGLEGNSHSSRMATLGKLLDSEISYEDACKKVGVYPDKPWEINFSDKEVLKKYWSYTRDGRFKKRMNTLPKHEQERLQKKYQELSKIINT